MTVRVLVVEDHPTMREAMRLVLEAEGFGYEAAADGDAAIASVRRRPPDVVFLDLNIPGTPGPEVLRSLKADPATAAIPVIVVTATGEEGRAEAVALGADGYVTKPFGPESLLTTVRRALASRGAARPGPAGGPGSPPAPDGPPGPPASGGA